MGRTIAVKYFYKIKKLKLFRHETSLLYFLTALSVITLTTACSNDDDEFNPDNQNSDEI